MTVQRFEEISIANAGDPVVLECLAEISRLAGSAYVPGYYKCPKCNFCLVKSVMNVASGTISADNRDGGECPNDGETMRPVTWQEDAEEMAALMPELARLRAFEREHKK